MKKTALTLALSLVLGMASLCQAQPLEETVAAGMKAYQEYVDGKGQIPSLAAEEGTPGVGFEPSAGSTVFWVEVGTNKPVGTTVLDPSAGDPFGDPARGTALNMKVFAARYGTPPVAGAAFPVYAETIGLLSRAMELACLSGQFNGSGRSCVPTQLEVHDYAALAQLGPSDPVFRSIGNGGPQKPSLPSCPECKPVPCPKADPCPACPPAALCSPPPAKCLEILRKVQGVTMLGTGRKVRLKECQLYLENLTACLAEQKVQR